MLFEFMETADSVLLKLCNKMGEMSMKPVLLHNLYYVNM